MELHVSLVGRNGVTNEIYRQVRNAIINGPLRPGDRLPPSRELAKRLSVSRSTVVVAYDRLSGEGFVTSRVGKGTFVIGDLRERGRDQPRTAGALRARPIWNSVPLATAFAQRADYDFRTGLPDTARFPFPTWRRLLAAELRASAAGGEPYGHPAGHEGLRHSIVRHLGISRGVDAVAADVTITNGTQQALDLVARVLLAPGDHVAVEDPGYEPARRLFESLGLVVIGVPVDSQGLVVDALPPTVRLVYVTPSHQYPLGMSMSLPRRVALLSWARDHNAAVVEDDYDSEFRFGGRPIEPLQTLDSSGRVIYVGSFSKTMLPTLRVGFLVAPAPLREAIHAAKYVTDWHTSLPTQAALARFIDEGGLGRHIRRMRTIYQERHDRIVMILHDDLSDHLTVIPSAAGLHISAEATRASPTDLSEVLERAQGLGVAFHRLSVFSFDQPARAGVTLGYGAIAASDIDEGLHRLRHCLDAVER